ncbi:hypothetical protein K437DRAFT_260182 [Tilletiaria anomala UBC 951]|uniref:HNH nuclease domain-containing protein n=1 Tax=Tilletiaria anomala (strain ATCC 24038 / CBS 436.72 / UBC 951) TaxID=1037660 RepID=A0A066VCC8_TILAU|nr:uncharacterized protein K437DRAFT_260182 [Tilletiaria anomala UBC 951]KDN36245.1 hypothetical protein K437DRAFT_260182 [Tilletiaria anomala UBC 951]
MEQLRSDETFTWQTTGGGAVSCTFHKGPRFKQSRRPPPPDGETSTMSNSSRSTANQSSFRIELIARDTKCLLTDAHWRLCTAAHIIPQSRPEYYAEILSPSEMQTLWPFEPQYGILVRDDLHRAFDRGEWALWPQGDDYIVHFLFPEPEERKYHGKVLTADRFSYGPEHRPHKDLLLFHYRQCAQKYFRGFSAGF